MNDRAPEVAIEYRRDEHDMEYDSEDEQLEDMATRVRHLAYDTAVFSGDCRLATVAAGKLGALERGWMNISRYRALPRLTRSVEKDFLYLYTP